MSFGNKLGRGLGTLGALAVEGAVRGASAAGQFGADVVEGTQQGYEEKHAALQITRAQAKAQREAGLAALRAAHIAVQNPAAVTMVAAPARRARAAV